MITFHKVVHSTLLIGGAGFVLFASLQEPGQSRLDDQLNIFLCFACIITFCSVQNSDPGYLIAGEYTPHRKPLLSSSIDMENGEVYIDDIVDNNECPEDFEFCRNCNFCVPIRSSHCRSCQKCVASFDHHCFVIDTCIGERNHFRFYIMILVHTFATRWYSLQFFAVGTSMPHVCAVFLSIVWVYLLILLGFQTWLMCTAMTGVECAKGPQGRKYLAHTQDFDLPFARPIHLNIFGMMLRDGWVHMLQGKTWAPFRWKVPGTIVRDSDNIWAHPWQNKYWRCC